MQRTWYITKNRAKVNWATAVVGGVATVTIYRLVDVEGTANDSLRVWRAAGTPISAKQVAAAQEAQSSDPVPAAPPSGPASGLVTDDRVAEQVSEGTKTREALNAEFLSRSDARATYSQRWRPSTAYPADALVISPEGRIVKRKADGTSGTTYDATAWDVVGDTFYASKSLLAASTFLGSSFGFFGDSQTNYGEGYPYYAALLAQGAFRATVVASNPGFTSTQLLPLITQITQAADKPTACLVLCGANDAQGQVPLATYRANVEGIVAALRAAGIAPVLGTVPPNNNDTYLSFTLLYSSWLARYAEVQRIPLVDFSTLLIDPATGDWKAAYNSGDGLHPSVAGNKAMGQAVVDTLRSLLTPRPFLLQPYAGTPNLLPNSNFLVDTNADGLADGVSGTSAAGFAWSLVNDAAGFKWQRITLSGGGTNRRQVLGSTVTVSSGKVAVGDRLRFAARVRTAQTAATVKNGSTLQITCYKSGYAGVTLNTIVTSPSGGISAQIDGVALTEFVVPAQTEIVQWTHLVGPDDGTYDVAQPTLLNLTALGAL